MAGAAVVRWRGLRWRQRRRGLARRRGAHLTGGADAAGSGGLGFPCLPLSFVCSLLSGGDALEHLAQPALALGLLDLELCQALGAGRALLGLLGSPFDLLQPPVGVLHCALGVRALRLQSRLGLLHRAREVAPARCPANGGALVDLLLQLGGVEPLLDFGAGTLLGLAAGLLGRLGDAGVGVAARFLDRLPGALLNLAADALGLLAGPLLGLQAQALGLLPDPLLHGQAGLLLGLPPGLLGGHPDQLLRLLLGPLRPIRSLGLQPLGPPQPLLDLLLDPLLVLGDRRLLICRQPLDARRDRRRGERLGRLLSRRRLRRGRLVEVGSGGAS